MHERRTKIFYVYITTSAPRGVLYVGMSSNIAERARQHRERILEGFTKKYWAGRLVYIERHDSAAAAKLREKSLKRWRRDWKIELVEKNNPTWRDLFSDVVAAEGYMW